MDALKMLGAKLGAAVLALMMSKTAIADTVTYFHNDIAGSPLAATDPAGNLLWKENYKPYGEKLTKSANSSSSNVGFHGKAHDDSTGLSYMGARYYDPLLGRFMGVDPVAYQEENLHSFNRYAYTNNNPYKYVDPDGKYADLMIETASLAIGFHSLNENTKSGNYAAATLDAAGIAVDGLLATVPFLPGASGLAIKAGREAADATKNSIQTEKIADLIPTHGRTMSNNQFKKFITQLKSEGIRSPLTVTKHQGEMYILDGHHRALAAPRAGISEAPVNEVQLPWGAYKTPNDLTYTPGGY